MCLESMSLCVAVLFLQPGERGLSLVQLSHDFLTSWTTFYSLLQGQFSSSSVKSLGKKACCTSCGIRRTTSSVRTEEVY